MGNGTVSKEDLVDELHQKIKSKMDVAKLLGTFLTGLLGGVLAIVGDPAKLKSLAQVDDATCIHSIICVGFGSGSYKLALLAAVISLLVAIILYFATVYAYDRLLMPGAFWVSEFNSGILYSKMIEAWNRLFNRATIFLGIGLALMVVALLRLGVVETILLAAIAALSLAYCRRYRGPEIED
jgi:hypothetical protein